MRLAAWTGIERATSEATARGNAAGGRGATPAEGEGARLDCYWTQTSSANERERGGRRRRRLRTMRCAGSAGFLAMRRTWCDAGEGAAITVRSAASMLTSDLEDYTLRRGGEHPHTHAWTAVRGSTLPARGKTISRRRGAGLRSSLCHPHRIAVAPPQSVPSHCGLVLHASAALLLAARVSDLRMAFRLRAWIVSLTHARLYCARSSTDSTSLPLFVARRTAAAEPLPSQQPNAQCKCLTTASPPPSFVRSMQRVDRWRTRSSVHRSSEPGTGSKRTRKVATDEGGEESNRIAARYRSISHLCFPSLHALSDFSTKSSGGGGSNAVFGGLLALILIVALVRTQTRVRTVPGELASGTAHRGNADASVCVLVVRSATCSSAASSAQAKDTPSSKGGAGLRCFRSNRHILIALLLHFAQL